MQGTPGRDHTPSTGPRARLPLRFYIVASFLILLGAVALVLGVVAGRGSQALVDQTVSASLAGRAELALQDLRRLDETARAAAESLAANPITRSAGREEREARLHALATVLRSVRGISAAYVGWPDGEFVLLRPVGMHAELLSAPDGAEWLVQWSGRGAARFDFLDGMLEVLETRGATSYDAFDPRSRPWFRDAMAAADTIVTAPYVFFTTREPGISAARRAMSGAVAGVDISLWDLSTRLPRGEPVPSTEAAILDSGGAVLAHADTARLRQALEAGIPEVASPEAEILPPAESLGSPVLDALAGRLRSDPAAYLGRLSAGGREWIATIAPLDLQGTAFVMAAPLDEIGAGSRSTRAWLLSIAGLTVLLAVPAAWYAARRLARPVEAFSAEIQRVAELDFTDPAQPKSGIAELARLDDAIRSMRASIACFTEVCHSVIEEADTRSLMGRVLDALMAAGNAGRGAAWIADADGGLQRLAVVPAAPAEAVADTRPDAGSVASRLAASREPAAFTADAGALGPGGSTDGGGPLSVLGVPLRTPSGRLVGALAIARPAAEGPFAPPVLAIVRFVARAAALSLDRPHLISEREAARRETELILSSVADGIQVLDAEGNIRRQNPAALAMLGWREAEAAGRPAHALMHHHHADGRLYDVAECPIHRTLGDGRTRRVEDEVFFRKDGSSVAVEYESSAIRGETGAIAGAVVSFRDVAERRRSQRELRERIKELRCLYRVLELTADPSRTPADACRAITGILRTSLLHEESAVATIRLEGADYRGDGWRPPLSTLRVAITSDGIDIGFVEVGYSDPQEPIAGSDGPFLEEERNMVAAVAAHIGRMVHDRRMTARLTQSERLNAIGQLTGGIAHDFNNLLTVILGSADSLSQDPDDDGRRTLAETIAKAAERGAELTRGLLAFGRRQPLDARPVDVNRHIADMDRMLRRTLGEQVEIEMMRGTGLWTAMVDAGQLESAILNLCINARDAMPQGGRLTIETANIRVDAAGAAWHELEPGEYVMVAVSDTGTGMDAGTLQHAFEPFFTTKEVGKGSGLGLSMVYGFAKQSKGHVRIRSAPGQGTTVRLYLPRALAEEATAEPARHDAAVETGSEKVLLVEDDDLVRDHVRGQLLSLGYRVVAVADGPQAIEALRRTDDFDLLFTDIVMPGGMSGHQLAEVARTLRPALPVLFTSGYTEDAVLARGGAGRGIDLLQKPYRRQQLAKRLRSLLDERSPRSAASSRRA